MSILIWIIFGAIVGWLASMLTSSSNGLLGNIVLGVIGAFIGGILMNLLGYTGVTGFDLYSVLVAVLGAIVLVAIGRVVS
jgi:uncharacterized membrane protein YeaQ/YmgE (transglycosylase-associated protein family)